jgi:circadian clock protein KaiC
MEEVGERLNTGVGGLDDILGGGLIARRSYLVRGGPGQGKTTLGLHFLAAADAGAPTLFIGFQEPEEQLRPNAAAIGIDVTGITFLSLAPDERFFVEQQGYDVFSAADVEQEPLANVIVQAVERHAPQRVFIDSLTQLRFLSADIFQYRKQVLSFLRFLTRQGATVLFSSESSRELPDDDLQFMADGVINFDSDSTGAAVRVSKMRGSGFLRGKHHMRLNAQGLKVFPRMIPPAPKLTDNGRRRWSSGAPAIDAMLHGGLEAGTVSLITGPSGVGKSTLASQFAAEATRQGSHAAIFLFEEELGTFLGRAKDLKIGLDQSIRNGRLIVELVEPMRYLADEFTSRVREHVERNHVDLVILDSISGFALTLEGEGVEARLHTFATTLARLGVSVLLINETQAVTGQFQVTERGISYIADNILFLRYMEIEGTLRKTLGVLKKRLSGFESTLRTYEIGRHGLIVAAASVHGLHGVLSGIPTQQEGD